MTTSTSYYSDASLAGACRRYERYQFEQITSLLVDRRECITAKSIMLELTVTRTVARSILEDVACQLRSRSSSGYKIINMSTMKTNSESCIPRHLGLTTTTTAESSSGDGGERPKKGTIVFSIAPIIIPPSSNNNEMMDITVNDDEDDNVDDDGNMIINSNSNNTNTKSHSDNDLTRILSATHEKSLSIQRGMEIGTLLSIFADTGSIQPAEELCGEDGIVRYVAGRNSRGGGGAAVSMSTMGSTSKDAGCVASSSTTTTTTTSSFGNRSKVAIGGSKPTYMCIIIPGIVTTPVWMPWMKRMSLLFEPFFIVQHCCPYQSWGRVLELSYFDEVIDRRKQREAIQEGGRCRCGGCCSSNTTN